MCNSEVMDLSNCPTHCPDGTCTRDIKLNWEQDSVTSTPDTSCVTKTECSMEVTNCENSKRSANTNDKEWVDLTEKDKAKTVEVWSNFAGVCAEFTKMAMDPKNPENVRSCICKMLEGMVNIGCTMTRGMPMTKEEVAGMAKTMDDKTMCCLAQTMTDEIMKSQTRCTKSE